MRLVEQSAGRSINLALSKEDKRTEGYWLFENQTDDDANGGSNDS